MKICDKEINIGDYVEVRYTIGCKFKNAIIKGKIIKLWDINDDDLPRAKLKQAQINNGWCFHDHDRILVHNPANLRGIKMIIIVKIFVLIAWLIPGKPHRWAKILIAERKAMLKYK